jgi:hypothetical protein
MTKLVSAFTNMKSRMNREVHIRRRTEPVEVFCGNLGVKFPGVTRLPNFYKKVR